MTLPASKTITTFNTWKAWLYDRQKESLLHILQRRLFHS